MPPIRSSTSKRRTRVIATILSLSKIISAYSRYVEKELVCVAIVLPSGRQLSSYAEYTKANMRSFYNVYSVSNAKYIYLLRL